MLCPLQVVGRGMTERHLSGRGAVAALPGAAGPKLYETTQSYTQLTITDLKELMGASIRGSAVD